MQARALGDFLRSRRQRLSPAEVGLPVRTARRVPGLRREEVAVLAGIGVSWLTRLEQGSASGVSADVLDALASALLLDDSERLHMHHLAGSSGQAASVEPATTSRDRASLERLVVAFGSTPAYVLDPRWGLVTWNDALTAVIPPLADYEPGVSFLKVYLTDEGVRKAMGDWELQARRVVTQFRSHAAEFPGPETERVIDAMTATSDLFSQVWREHDVDRFQATLRSFTTSGGTVHFEQHRMALTDRPGWSVTVFIPSDNGRHDP